MKTLIYQYWLGERPLYGEVSQQMFQEYARLTGSDYRYDSNPSYFKGKYGVYYHALRPLFDEEFHQYDRVLYVDMDVYTAKGLTENIFELDFPYIAMAQEPDQPELRSKTDGKISLKNDLYWAKVVKWLYGIELPVDALGRPLVYNAGVLLYTKDGMKFAAEKFLNIKRYAWAMGLSRLPRFYRNDQNYLHVCGFMKDFTLTELSNDWNSIIHQIRDENGEIQINDGRSSDSKFVHLQARNRSEKTADELVKYVQDLPA